ncbi:hypothetical protein BYT27DRAFT_7189777 [Phlegmacium glaucopus]|nr:hypothetical protein BYT27DRAFT_7189777 [Phlegmacium glaucopus]
MSAYRRGLTGNAAAWAVRKQKQHWQVSNRAMMSIDAVLNYRVLQYGLHKKFAAVFDVTDSHISTHPYSNTVKLLEASAARTMRSEVIRRMQGR